MLNEITSSLEFVIAQGLNVQLATEAAFVLLRAKGNSTRVVQINTQIDIDISVGGIVASCLIFYSTGTQVPLLTSQKPHQNG